MTNILIGIGAVVLIALLIGMSYVKTSPQIALVISGIRKEPRIIAGSGGFRIPILERVDRLFLGQVTIDVKTAQPVPTHDCIDVTVDAVCKVKVKNDQEHIRLAATNFLNLAPEAIGLQIKDSLEGNMKEVVGSIDLKPLVTDRDAFSNAIDKTASVDIDKLGLEIISCNIQYIKDNENLIESLGADNSSLIRKNAAITKANADKEIKIAQAIANKEANDADVESQTEIAKKQNALKIQKAELKQESDARQAEADAAYKIQEQVALKKVYTNTVDAQIEQTKRQQVLADENVKLRKNELEAQVNAEADAAKYKVETEAQAALEQQKREAEAVAYVAEQEAKAKKAQAEATKYAALQEAEGIKARGLAEADATAAKLKAEAEGIKAKGIAEAEAMQKKAEAYERYGQVAIIDMLTKMNEKVLPEVAKYIAEPMGKIGGITIYGGSGDEAAGVSANVPIVMKKTFDVVKDATGFDLTDTMRSTGIDAKTNRNINLSSDGNPIVQLNS
jgi:flotillin